MPEPLVDAWRSIVSKEAQSRLFSSGNLISWFAYRARERARLRHSKVTYSPNVVLYDYARYDRKKWNRRRPLSRRIRIWLLHFACDSYTMRSIGSCRLLPLSDYGTSACLFPPSFRSYEIPTYPHIFIRFYGKIWERFSVWLFRLTSALRIGI